MSARYRRLGGATTLVALSACADRGLASAPPSSPGGGTWAIVSVAAVAAGLVLAALIVMPARRPGGAGFAAWVLALQAGGLTIAGAVVVGAALRSGQLLTRPEDAEQAASLLRLSGLDGGDTQFFKIVVIVTVLLGGLLAAVLALAARFAADADPLERGLAAAVLGLEVLGSVACAVLVAIGFRHAGFVLPALSLPVLVAATMSAWPHPRTSGPERDRVGYNGPHG